MTTLGRAAVVGFFLLLGSVGAWASEYSVSWEGDDLPENQGWTRVWGDWQGQYHGTGAHRTLANGVLSYDSLYDLGVYDGSEIVRPGQVDPQNGEHFIMEWRLNVKQVIGWTYDPTVTICSDDAWAVAFEWAVDHLESSFENAGGNPVTIPVTPSVFHDYRMLSSDMRNYELYIDGTLARNGTFRHLVSRSRVAWGDGVQGAGSLHDWDYFRFGVAAPEPATLWWVLALTLRVFRREERAAESRCAPP